MTSRLLAAAALLAVAAPLAAQQIALAPGETLLEIDVTGSSTARPDVAMISMGVVTTGTTAKEATDANAAQMATVVAAIGKAGVDPRYVRTQQITVEPRFAHRDGNDYQGQAQITGYVARNSVGVTVTKLAIASDVIAAAFAAGANSVSGPNLQLRDNEAALAAARHDAIARARSEADAYADALGMRVSRVLRVSQRGSYTNRDIYVSASRRSFAAGAPPHRRRRPLRSRTARCARPRRSRSTMRWSRNSGPGSRQFGIEPSSAIPASNDLDESVPSA